MRFVFSFKIILICVLRMFWVCVRGCVVGCVWVCGEVCVGVVFILGASVGISYEYK